MFTLGFQDFLMSIYKAQFGFGAGKDTGRSKPKIGMMQFFNAFIHILTASAINDERELVESDYIHTIGLFVLVTTVTTVSSLLNLGFGLILFQWVMLSLEALNASLFYTMITAFILGNILVRFSHFIAKSTEIYVREKIVMIFRFYMEKRYTNRPENVDVSENQRAFFESIEVACAHIPAMIKISVVVICYGSYAVYYFNPSLLLASTVIGILVQYVNRGASKKLDKANSQERSLIQKIQMERGWAYRNRYPHEGINAIIDTQYSIMGNSILSLHVIQMNHAINKAMQDFLAETVKLLSNAFYYLYFSSAVFLGYMTLGEMFILMPFIEEIGKTAAKLIALPMMASPTRSSGENLIIAWNELIDEPLKVRENMKLVKVDRGGLIWDMGIALLMILGLQYWLVIPALNVASVVVSLLFANAILFPNSFLAQLWIYCVKVCKYLFQSPKEEGKGERSCSSTIKIDVQYGNYSFNVNNGTYEFDPSIFSESNNMYQVEGYNGVGKTITFSHLCPSKPYKEGKRIPGYFPSDESMVVTPSIGLYYTEDYYKRLATTFGTEEEGLKTFLKGVTEEIFGEQYELSDLDLSRGMQQFLYVFSAIYKAIILDYKYICIDEALSGLAESILDPIYENIIEKCTKDNLTLVVVHHGYDVKGLQKIAPVVDNNTIKFQLK